MAQRTVNTRQLEVLRWIVDGCPDGVMFDNTYKTTAIALKGRRLVVISKKGGSWEAAATEAGRYFAKHGAYPDGHWKASSTQASGPRGPRTLPRVTRTSANRQVTGLRPVDQLVADLVAEGGSLHFEQDENGYYENLANSAVRYGKVPEGKLIRVRRGRRYGEKTIELVDKPSWMTTVLEPIPIPARLSRPHPAIIPLRVDRENRLCFKRDLRQRALILLNALAREATHRGYAVTCPTQQRYARQPACDLSIEVNGHRFELEVTEDTDKVPHEPTARELRDFETRGWPRIPKYDRIASGRLAFAVGGGTPVRQAAFRDTKTLTLDNRLALVLQEIELRAAEAEDRRLQRERDDADRRRQWEEVHAQALISHRENHRARVLRTETKEWQDHRLLTEYAVALTAETETLEGEVKAAAEEWLAWIRLHLESTRPFRTPPRMPSTPDPKPDDLKPHMQGLSPYGPDNAVRGW